jgi:hypothetical protein
MLNPSGDDLKLLRRSKQSRTLDAFLQPLIVLTPKKIFGWDMHGEDG